MTDDEAARMIEGISQWDVAIVIFPSGDQSGCRWLGMSAEQVAVTLYKVADEILLQRVPLKQFKVH